RGGADGRGGARGVRRQPRTCRPSIRYTTGVAEGGTNEPDGHQRSCLSSGRHVGCAMLGVQLRKLGSDEGRIAQRAHAADSGPNGDRSGEWTGDILRIPARASEVLEAVRGSEAPVTTHSQALGAVAASTRGSPALSHCRLAILFGILGEVQARQIKQRAEGF